MSNRDASLSDMAALLHFEERVTIMVLVMMLVLVIGLGLVGSRALLWTVLFLMTRQIVRNVNMTSAFDHDSRDLRLASPTV